MTQSIIDQKGLGHLIAALANDGYQVIGPKIGEGAIIYDPIASADELPVGWKDTQDGGSYRLERSERKALFDYVVGPHSWKRYLFPAKQRLWRAERQGKSFQISAETDEIPRYAFIGVRSCEIQAMQVQDRVFSNGSFSDPAYVDRRERAFVVAVNCARPAATCFCASMNSGPKADSGFDLALTEILDDERHEFVLEVGSERGTAMLAKMPHRTANAGDIAIAAKISADAAKTMTRQMVPNVADLLKQNLDHVHWDDVAERCLTCGNCTMVCPTCFCTSVEDTTDLSGDIAERWRHWDSCFTLDFSYLHGGGIRNSGKSRYRQWMTHKLAHWHDQFDSSGCVGCGRCITWCPVGIDITAEAKSIQASEG